MKQFELKFTEENLRRHLSYNPFCIYTVRDEMKGYVGDLTIINSIIYYVYDIHPITLKEIRDPSCTFWIDEGFSSQKEYVEEIEQIYGSDLQKRLHIMELYIVGKYYTEEMMHNSVMGKYYRKYYEPPKRGIKGLWGRKMCRFQTILRRAIRSMVSWRM